MNKEDLTVKELVAGILYFGSMFLVSYGVLWVLGVFK